jgi:hypothetical protein
LIEINGPPIDEAMPVTAIVPSLLERGLSRRDAERRLARFRPNALPDPTQVLRWQQGDGGVIHRFFALR